MRYGIDDELKKYWEIVSELEKKLEEQRKQIESTKKAIKMFKSDIRKLNKLREEYKPEPQDMWRERYPYDGYGDSRYVKYKLPFHLTEEEKQEFIEEEWCHWYNPWNDGRDCTGVWFTSRIRLVDCGNETIVIHCQNCDV